MMRFVKFGYGNRLEIGRLHVTWLQRPLGDRIERLFSISWFGARAVLAKVQS